MNIFLKLALIVLAVALVVPVGALNSQADEALTGKVIETMDSGGYTYVQIENNGKKTWVAVSKTKVQKGQNITFSPGAEMKNFESKTLKRKFDSIIFSGGVVGAQVGGETKSPGSKGSAVTVTERIKVDKAPGPDSYTVAEIFKNSKNLQEKNVVVRGKVVKVSAGVMKKNWVHLQDGTGEPGSNDLVVTSDDLPQTGDVVTASGTLYNDKDFGGGSSTKSLLRRPRSKTDPPVYAGFYISDALAGTGHTMEDLKTSETWRYSGSDRLVRV
jgi:hypothetical protein